MVIPYTKPHLSFSEQITLLQSRGMTFKDTGAAELLLSSVGYYHLSAYWYPFRQIDPATATALDDFKSGVSFEAVCGLMQFDARLKSILFEIITEIEIWLRCGIAYESGKQDPTGYYTGSCIDREYLPGGCKQVKRDRWKDKLDQQVQNSKEVFIEHFKNKYQPPLPVWVSCELWDFGMSSKLFNMLSRSCKNAICAHLGINTSSLLASWLHTMNIVRNICAHNARLWNRHIAVLTRIPNAQQVPALSFLSSKGYAPESLATIIFISAWLHRQIMPHSTKCQKLKAHLDSLSTIQLPGLNHSMMGFHADWGTEALWAAPATIRPNKNKKPARTFSTSILKKWHFRQR